MVDGGEQSSPSFIKGRTNDYSEFNQQGAGREAEFVQQ